MTDIVTALDNSLQPRPPSRSHIHPQPHPLDSVLPDDTAHNIVIAQIQYDVIERAYFQRPMLSPLDPTTNGKTKSPCWICNHLTFSTPTSGQPRALRTGAVNDVLPNVTEVRTAANNKQAASCWFPRRRKPASWDLHDDALWADLQAQRRKRQRDERHEALRDEVKLLSQKGISPPWQGQLAEIARARAELQTCSLGRARHSKRLFALATRAVDALLRRETHRERWNSVYLASFTH